MVNINIKDGIDTLSSTNTFIPTGSLIMKASAATALVNYDTDVKCISAGYIPCDGRILNATTFTSYQNLFDVVGNIYGGTNNTNFKVPDLRTSRRYIYGQGAIDMIFGSPNFGVYVPSFSANITNAVTHSHTVNRMSGQNLTTNAAAGSHSHSTSYTFSSGGGDYHSHTWEGSMPALTSGGASGTTLTKSDGTGTAAGAAHTHSSGQFSFNFNSSNSGEAHDHSGSGDTDSYSEPTHTHSFNDSNVSIPVSSAINIPYINMLYFIKI